MRYSEFLKDNGTIGFVAPSFGCATEPYYTAFQNALMNFHTMGFQTEIGPNCLVEQGVGAAILPESVSNTLAGKNLSLKRIADPEVYSYVAILTKKYRTLSKAANALLTYVKESSRTTS